jgi:tetratricopeptide (TPR) repeat protein
MATALFAALLVAQASVSGQVDAAAPPAPLVSARDLELAKKSIPTLLGRVRRGELTTPAKPSAPPVERFLAAYGIGDGDVAWKLFKRLQQDEPDLPWGETGMGRIYVQWRLWDQAQAAFGRALRLVPGFSIALVERGAMWRALKQPDKARADADAALAQDPQDARALLLVAQLDDDAGAKPLQRQAEYAVALAQAPDLYEAGAALAALAEAAGDTRGALAALEKLAEASPRDAKLQRQIAGLRRRVNDLPGAARALEAAVAQGLASKDALEELAAIAEKTGDRDKEEAALKRLRRLDPKDRRVVVRLAQLHQGDPGAQLEDASALLAFDPHDAWAHLMLAEARRAAHDTVGQLLELDEARRGKAHPEAREAPEQARVQSAALRAELGVPETPLSAKTVNGLYYRASAILTRAYEKRRAERPDLRGHLELKVRINGRGGADSVELVRDGIGDKSLATCLQATLREAQYPTKQTTLTFKFDLAPPKGAGAPRLSGADPQRKRPE